VLKSTFGNSSFRRLLVVLLGLGATLLHKKFGLVIEPGTLEMVASMVVAYLVSGNLKSAVDIATARKLEAQKQAKEAVPLAVPESLEKAAAELAGKKVEK